MQFRQPSRGALRNGVDGDADLFRWRERAQLSRQRTRNSGQSSGRAGHLDRGLEFDQLSRANVTQRQGALFDPRVVLVKKGQGEGRVRNVLAPQILRSRVPSHRYAGSRVRRSP